MTKLGNLTEPTEVEVEDLAMHLRDLITNDREAPIPYSWRSVAKSLLHFYQPRDTEKRQCCDGSKRIWVFGYYEDLNKPAEFYCPGCPNCKPTTDGGLATSESTTALRNSPTTTVAPVTTVRNLVCECCGLGYNGVAGGCSPGCTEWLVDKARERGTTQLPSPVTTMRLPEDQLLALMAAILEVAVSATGPESRRSYAIPNALDILDGYRKP